MDNLKINFLIVVLLFSTIFIYFGNSSVLNIENLKENNNYNYIYYVNPKIENNNNNNNNKLCGININNSCSSISSAINSFKQQTSDVNHKHQSLTLLLFDGIYNLNKENHSEITIFDNINSNIKLINLNFQHIKSTTLINYKIDSNNNINNNNNNYNNNENIIILKNIKIIDSIDFVIVSNLVKSKLYMSDFLIKNNSIEKNNFSLINIQSSKLYLNNTIIENNQFSNSSQFIYDNFNSTIEINNSFILYNKNNKNDENNKNKNNNNNNNNNNNFLFCETSCIIKINNNHEDNGNNVNKTIKLVIESTRTKNLSTIIICDLTKATTSTKKETSDECEFQIIPPMKINEDNETIIIIKDKRTKYGSDNDSGGHSDNSSQEKQFMKSLEIFVVCIGLIISFAMIVSAIYYLNKCYLKYHPDYYSEYNYDIIPDL
ncbi:hypothetical protein RB653_003568 [Dictyostelium firmibasis]|uniref:Transmembrane protein n=1 Tax=Dictyostelium firmibasis TaxID=79012 RepID=A0AAN7TZG0_9MYCE